MWTVLDQTTLMQKNICFSRSRVVAHRPCPKLEMFSQSILQFFYGCSKVLVTTHDMKPKTVWRFELSYPNLWPFDSDWNLVFPDYENEIYHFVGVLNYRSFRSSSLAVKITCRLSLVKKIFSNQNLKTAFVIVQSLNWNSCLPGICRWSFPYWERGFMLCWLD